MSQPYTIRKDKDGSRYVFTDGKLIPAELAALAAGRDTWMRDIECKCRDCGQKFPLHRLQGGGQWCDNCVEASIEEGQ